MEQKYYIDLGYSIRQIRRSKNLSQEYMALKLNISQNVYSKIESGKCKCTVYRFMVIMNLLNVNPIEVLMDNEVFQKEIECLVL